MIKSDAKEILSKSLYRNPITLEKLLVRDILGSSLKLWQESGQTAPISSTKSEKLSRDIELICDRTFLNGSTTSSSMPFAERMYALRIASEDSSRSR